MSSQFTFIRIRNLPYDALLDNAIMSTSLAQDIPRVFSEALDMSANNFIVVSIGKSSPSSINNQTQKRSESIAVIVTMAVPYEVVKPLQTLVGTENSKLYTMSLGQLPRLIDPTYPVESRLGKARCSYEAIVFQIANSYNRHRCTYISEWYRGS